MVRSFKTSISVLAGVSTMKQLIMLFLLGIIPLQLAHSALVFEDDFDDGDLVGWTGKGGGAHQGVNVADPLESDRALTWTGLNAAGDIFTEDVFSAGAYTLTFDYLGLVSPASTFGNLGGFIGISEGLPGDHRWLEGTILCCGAESGTLIDDSTWHSYSVAFTSTYDFHLMLEDFSGSGGIAGDAFFDNIRLYDSNPEPIPEPHTTVLLGLGLLSLGLSRRRPKR